MHGTPGKVLDRQRATEAAPVAPLMQMPPRVVGSTSRSVRYSRLRLQLLHLLRLKPHPEAASFPWK